MDNLLKGFKVCRLLCVGVCNMNYLLGLLDDDLRLINFFNFYLKELKLPTSLF